MRLRVFSAGLLVAFLLGLAACGGDGDSGKSAGPGETRFRLTGVAELQTLHPDIDWREAVLSPDASTLVWDAKTTRNLCWYRFVDDAVACAPYPADLESIINLTWSPDSRYLAFTENMPRYFDESDVWIFSLDTRTFTNRTDEGLYGAFVGNAEIQSQVPLDLVPTWSVGGDLYFFRSAYGEGPTTNALYRIRADRLLANDAPELVIDFSEQVGVPVPVYTHHEFDSLDGAAAVSPDGQQLAVLIRPPDWDAPQWGIWLFDLQTAAVTQIVSLGALAAPDLLPAWIDARVQIRPMGLAWVGGGDGIVFSGYDPRHRDDPTPTNVYYLDVVTRKITPLVALSGARDAHAFAGIKDDDGYTLADNLPHFHALSPDGTTLFYTAIPNGAPPRVSVLPLPPSAGGNTPVRLGVVEALGRLPASPTSSGTDGGVIRVIMLGRLFTFERDG